MNTNYPTCSNLEDGNNQKASVILLLGQSNALGASLTEYLKKNVSNEKFQEYENGYDNVLINYCIDDQVFSSNGQFVKTNLDCGSGKGFFGPEVGLAEALSRNYEKTFILKYTMSGYSLISLASYLREDLKEYNKNEIYFIDAGISNSPYCEPGYPIVNDAKERFAKLSKYNIYFSTIDLEFITALEPDYELDLGHYDSLCEIALGNKFGEEILSTIK